MAPLHVESFWMFSVYNLRESVVGVQYRWSSIVSFIHNLPPPSIHVSTRNIWAFCDQLVTSGSFLYCVVEFFTDKWLCVCVYTNQYDLMDETRRFHSE